MLNTKKKEQFHQRMPTDKVQIVNDSHIDIVFCLFLRNSTSTDYFFLQRQTVMKNAGEKKREKETDAQQS